MPFACATMVAGQAMVMVGCPLSKVLTTPLSPSLPAASLSTAPTISGARYLTLCITGQTFLNSSSVVFRSSFQSHYQTNITSCF